MGQQRMGPLDWRNEEFATDLAALPRHLGQRIGHRHGHLGHHSYHLQPALNTSPSSLTASSKFISEDGEASGGPPDGREELHGEETELPFEPDEDSESILDELLDDIHQEEAEALQ